MQGKTQWWELELEVRGCGAGGGWGCCRWCRIAMHSSRFTIYENEICYCHFDELYFEQFSASTHNSQSTCCLADSLPQPPLSGPPSAVPHLANCRIMFYIAVDNNANKSTIQRIQAAATNRQNKKAPNDDDEKLLKMSSFVWRHILDEAGPGVALTLWLQVRLRLRQRLWLLTDQ